MYIHVPMSGTLGPWGVPSDVIRKRRTRVTWLHGLHACRVVTWFVPVRVAWLHGLPIALALALAGSASFNAVAFLVVIYIILSVHYLYTPHNLHWG